MVSYELTLRLDYDILGRVRNQNWDLSVLPPGFIIQLRGDYFLRRRQQHRLAPAIIPNPNYEVTGKFVFKEESFFLSYQGMRQFLSDFLHDQHLLLSPSGRILCDGGLKLFRFDATASTVLASPSFSIYTIKKLVGCVIKTCKWMENSHRIRKLVPIAIDMDTFMAIIQYPQQQQFHRRGVESVDIHRSKPRQTRMAEALVAEEEIKGGSCQEKDCAICLEKLCVGQKGGRMSCTHLFHKECILHWLEKSSSCPLCRSPAALSSPTTFVTHLEFILSNYVSSRSNVLSSPIWSSFYTSMLSHSYCLDEIR